MKIFIAPDKSALTEVFPDARTLIEYGCESVLNIPAIFQGKVMGSVNLLHREYSYDDVDLAPAIIIVQMLIPYILDAGFAFIRSGLPGQITENV